MAHKPRHSPENMVLSGIIPHVLEQIVEYSAETAEELCRLALVCRDWSVASESNTIWKPLCLKLRRDFDTLTYNQQALARAECGRTRCKYVYVRFETVKAKMRKGLGVWKEPVELRLQFDDDRVHMISAAEMYLFVVTVDDRETVLVYSRDTGQLVNTLETQHTGGIGNMWSDETGGTLVTNAIDDSAVRIWDVASGACRHTIQPQLNFPCASIIVFYPWQNDKRVLLVENRLNAFGPVLIHNGDIGLSSYDVQTGELMQTSAAIEDIGCLVPSLSQIVGSSGYALIVTCAVDGTDAEYLTLWDLQFLTCELVIETAGRGAQSRCLLIDAGSTSIIAHTYCHELPCNAEDRDSVTVWDFTGAIKLQLQTTDGDRFYDVVVSQRKLIILQAHSITVWCLMSGRMQNSTDLRPGQVLGLTPVLHKYLYVCSLLSAPNSRLVQSRVDCMLDTHLETWRCSTTRVNTVLHDISVDVVVKEQDSPIMHCHKLDFSLPYP